MNACRSIILFFVCALSSSLVWAIEEPAFEVVESLNGVEYRQYQPYLVASTLVSGDVSRDKAASIGFRRLFKYIRGDNEVGASIEMTAPVRQERQSVKIAMTAPVRQGKVELGWRIAFVLPSELRIGTVPKPANPEITVNEIPGELVAALQYSGRWTAGNVSRYTAELLAELTRAKVQASGDVTVAYYNSPFSLPFTRRNEVMTTVAGVPDSSISSR